MGPVWHRTPERSQLPRLREGQQAPKLGWQGGTGVSSLRQAPFVCPWDLFSAPGLSWDTLYLGLQLWVLEMLCWPVSLPGWQQLGPVPLPLRAESRLAMQPSPTVLAALRNQPQGWPKASRISCFRRHLCRTGLVFGDGPRERQRQCSLVSALHVA